MQLEKRLLVKQCIETLEMEKLSPIFYRVLFQLDFRFKSVFSGNVVVLNRKFINMMATFKNVKYLETISDSVAQMGERHRLQYGAEVKHFPQFKQALLIALEEYLGSKLTPELIDAWETVFDEVSEIMLGAMGKVPESELRLANKADEDIDELLLNDIGGEAVILAVHKRLYDVLFDEPWLEKFFLGKSKEVLIKKQTDFMLAAFNGENRYKGDTPAFVHMHMFITDEMVDIREKILYQAILAEGLAVDIAERWLQIDRLFRPAVVKKSIDECVLKCKGQMPIVAPKPKGYRFEG